ncbi:MAG: hypothetical protein ACR2PM_09975 [Hyphomicrobiales bacterium]
MRNGQTAKFTLAAAIFALPLIGAVEAAAEGDWPYNSGSSQDYENNYAKYKTNDGFVTNFDKELFPVNPFGNDGKLYFRDEEVRTSGTSGARLEDNKTSLQLQFKF